MKHDGIDWQAALSAFPGSTWNLESLSWYLTSARGSRNKGRLCTYILNPIYQLYIKCICCWWCWWCWYTVTAACHTWKHQPGLQNLIHGQRLASGCWGQGVPTIELCFVLPGSLRDTSTMKAVYLFRCFVKKKTFEFFVLLRSTILNREQSQASPFSFLATLWPICCEIQNIF